MDALCGVAICGRPTARKSDDGRTLEIYRNCTNGTRNACSMLYGACCRIAKDMGYKRVITYTLASEDGASLKASGFTCEGEAGGLNWTGERKREYFVAPAEMKRRWVKNWSNGFGSSGGETMGEKSDTNYMLYMDNGEGYTPLGEIKEVSFDSGEDAYIPLDLTGTMTITFKPKWRSRLKTWWMLTGRWPLKRLFCKHHWVMAHEVNKYIDASGYTVHVWRCYCQKCGKWMNRKYR